MVDFIIDEEGRNIVRVRKIQLSELPQGMFLHTVCKGFVDVLAVYKDGAVSPFDITDMLNYLDMSFMEFKLALGEWLAKNNLDDGEWVRIKIRKRSENKENIDL